MVPGVYMTISPKDVHRLSADEEDLIVIECSTPELDDVVEGRPLWPSLTRKNTSRSGILRWTQGQPTPYNIRRGQQGVLICEPYKSHLCAMWRFKTPEENKSAQAIYIEFMKYLMVKDFVGADMASISMGFTRARDMRIIGMAISMMRMGM